MEEEDFPSKKPKASTRPKWLTDTMVRSFESEDNDVEDVVLAITKAFKKTPDSKKFDKLEEELSKAHTFLKKQDNLDGEKLQLFFDSVYDDTEAIPRKWREDGGEDDY